MNSSISFNPSFSLIRIRSKLILALLSATFFQSFTFTLLSIPPIELGVLGSIFLGVCGLPILLYWAGRARLSEEMLLNKLRVEMAFCCDSATLLYLSDPSQRWQASLAM